MTNIKKYDFYGIYGMMMGVYIIGAGLGSIPAQYPGDWGMFITGWVIFFSFAISEKYFTKKYGGDK